MRAEPEYDDKCKVCGMDIPTVLNSVCWRCQDNARKLMWEGSGRTFDDSVACLIDEVRTNERDREMHKADVEFRDLENARIDDLNMTISLDAWREDELDFFDVGAKEKDCIFEPYLARAYA